MASHPLGRIAEPEEVADSIVWLATSKSSYVTGVALPVATAATWRADPHQHEPPRIQGDHIT